MYEYAVGFKPTHLRSHLGWINRPVISIADEIADRGGGATIGEMVKQSLEGKFPGGLATIGKRQKTRCPHKWCWRKGIHIHYSYHAQFGEHFKDRVPELHGSCPKLALLAVAVAFVALLLATVGLDLSAGFF